MADVDPDAIDAFAKWCKSMAAVLLEYRSNLDGKPMRSGGLANGVYPEAPTGKIPAVSDGTEFAGEPLYLGGYPEGVHPPGIDIGAKPGGSGISPWAHAMAQEWNMAVRGRITDLERAYSELVRLAEDLEAVAQNWRDADDISAAEIAAQNSEIDYHDREW